MKLISARQAIHDAYAVNLRSNGGLDGCLMSEAKKPDFGQYLRKIHRSRFTDGNGEDSYQDQQVKTLKEEIKRNEKLKAFNPVGYYREDSSQKLNNNNLICDAVEAGMIIAAVENLAEPIKSWLKWAYAPRTEHFLPEQGRFFRWLDQDVTDNFETVDRVYLVGTKEKIRDVVAYTVLNYRSFAIDGKELYPTSLIINRCKIHRQNWKRDFESWHNFYWNLCDTYLDKFGLPNVSNVVMRLKYGAEENPEKEEK